MRGMGPKREASTSRSSAVAPPDFAGGFAASEGSASLITISCRAPLLPSMMVTVREPGRALADFSAGRSPDAGAAFAAGFGCSARLMMATAKGSPLPRLPPALIQTKPTANKASAPPAIGSVCGGRKRFAPLPRFFLRGFPRSSAAKARSPTAGLRLGRESARFYHGRIKNPVRQAGGGFEAIMAKGSVRNRGLHVGRVGRVLLYPAHEFHRHIELLVVLRIGRDVSRRALLLLLEFRVLEMAAERGLAAGLDLALQVFGQILHEFDIGLDALRLDRTARRREVARGRELERAEGADRDHGLHRAFAEGAAAEERRALVVLQRARDDFRRRSRTAVDQDDDRLAAGDIAGMRVVAHRVFRIAAASRDDLAAFEEGVGDEDRLIEETAAVIAKVDDVAL